MKTRYLIPSAALLLSSCMLGPDFQLPGLTGGSKWKQTQPVSGAHLPDAWWRLFNDRELTRLVERALTANDDLAAARARMETARALVGVDRARLFPKLDLNGSAGLTRLSEEAITRGLPSGLSGFDIDLSSEHYRGTFDLAYDLDLWGRNRRQLEASTAQADATAALFDAQRLGIAAEVARQYFVLRGLDSQETVLRNTIESRGKTLDLQKSKQDAGLTDALPTSQARTELELATHDLALVERQRGSAEHALAVLCGARPSDFSVARQTQSGSFPNIRAGLPAEVLSRRPDVRAAEQELRAANARIGVAEAAFYPNFSLTGSGGFESLSPRTFLDWENRVLSLGAGVAAPVFHGGANKANFQASITRRDEALANYRKTLLVALREVEDALVDLKGLARSRAALDQALASAKESQRLASDRHDNGLNSYLEVVESDRTVLRVELVLAQIDAQQRVSLAALAKALGGGWGGK